jgi:hypothetical protein
MIIWICRGTNECVGWNTTVIGNVKLDQTRYTAETRDHESMESKVVRLFSRVYAFCEGHAIMDCPFVPFHIRASIIRHVELQRVARALMDQP